MVKFFLTLLVVTKITSVGLCQSDTIETFPPSRDTVYVFCENYRFFKKIIRTRRFTGPIWIASDTALILRKDYIGLSIRQSENVYENYSGIHFRFINCKSGNIIGDAQTDGELLGGQILIYRRDGSIKKECHYDVDGNPVAVWYKYSRKGKKKIYRRH